LPYTPISTIQSVPKTTSCDIRANNNAINNGFNMISQSNTLIDYDNKLVKDIFDQDFTLERSNRPTGKGGLVFWTDEETGDKTHVEFYTYTPGSQTYNCYRNTGTEEIGVLEYSALNPSGNATFVPLNTLPWIFK
jgi:hypothetical protein